MEPDNAARALLAALRDDWQPPVKIRKERRRQPAATEQAPVLASEEEAEFVRKVKEETAALRAQLRREDAGSLKKPSLLEAEITGPAGGRGTDNHVIQHLDLQEPGAFAKSAS